MEVGERLEQAFANASARGIRIDFGRPIKEYVNYDYRAHRMPPPVRDRVVDEEGKLKDPGIPGVFSAEGRQTRAGARPGAKRHEELAYAAAGMDPLPLAAVLWCLGLDDRSRSYLRAELLKLALYLKETQRWPPKLRRAECEKTGLQRCQNRYVVDLVTLALREGADPDVYKTEAARALWFGIAERHWRRSGIAQGYDAVFGELVAWYTNGIGYLLARLRSAPSGSAGSRRMSGV